MSERPTAECVKCGAEFPMPANGWDLYYSGQCPACRDAVDPKYLNRAARERLALRPTASDAVDGRGRG